ncbi:hypothetical protein KIN20_006162 [Parelaphostrongylus tenuis]|uniref:Uncharacterized protein n=1 Tax=Parelaphostrongylus tenuis TaxID=148309 RepID=A0AAD5QKS5_PARTN|nr:hypothetical protein KIN20_006162 [Parelaphostrongylus tenuis]
MVMGVERVIATTWPIIYTKHVRDRRFFPGNHLMVVGCLRNGRRATFTILYAQIIYVWEMLGYVISLLLNIFAYIKAMTQVTSPIIRYQLKRTRICLAFAALSTVFVASVNVKSLLHSCQTCVNVSSVVSQIVNFGDIIKSTMNIFMYTWLHKKFRGELIKLLRVRRLFRTASVIGLNHRSPARP